MPDLETRARAEALREHPVPDEASRGIEYPIAALREYRRTSFVMGALWAARLEPSDAEVEAAARAIAQTVHTLALSGIEDGTRESALTDYIARTALTAARQAQKEG